MTKARPGKSDETGKVVQKGLMSPCQLVRNTHRQAWAHRLPWRTGMGLAEGHVAGKMVVSGNYACFSWAWDKHSDLGILL